MKKIVILLCFILILASCKQRVDKKPTPVLETYTITVTQPENGKISVTNKTSGTKLDDMSLKKVTKNTEITISIKADQGYKEVSLTIDGNTYIENSKDITVAKSFTISGEVTKIEKMNLFLLQFQIVAL